MIVEDLVQRVVPKNVATFSAVRLELMTPGTIDTITALAENIGARVQGWTITTRRGAKVSVFRIVGKNRKVIDIAEGDWFLVLGTSGAMRVCSNRQYKHDYKEING
jgi:hypothetical protein